MKNLTIAKRVTLTFSVVLAAMLALGVFTHYELGMVHGSVLDVSTNSIPSLQSISDVRATVRGSLVLTYQHIGSSSDADMNQIEAKIDSDATRVSADLDTYEKLASPVVIQLLEQAKGCRTNYLILSNQILAASRGATNAETIAKLYQRARTELDPPTTAFLEALDKCQEQEHQEAEDSANAALSASSRADYTLLFGVLGAFLLAGGLVFLTIQGMNRILQHVSSSLEDGAKQVAAAAGQVSSASQTLATGSSEQASSLEETGSSLEGLAAMTKRNSENTQKASDSARQAHDAANHGVVDMQTMAQAMDAIHRSSDDIAKIIKTIDEIAFQTNILALNAAVEAARAGEAGMGFAVVADEVRNLAQRCAHAARETANKIEDAITKTSQGVEISGKVAGALNQIAAKVRQVDELVAEIATSSREQSEGIVQINSAVGQMDQVTQTNTATAEESAAAAEELSVQAGKMKESVNELLRLVSGSNRPPEAGAFVHTPTTSVRQARTSFAHPVATRNGSNHGMRP